MLCRLCFVTFTFIPTMLCTPKRCPRYRYQWLQKSKEMGCVEEINGSYHCFLDQNGNLTEICFPASRIKPSEVGCPLFDVTDGVTSIVKPFRPCQVEEKECPRQYHRYYYTDELYKYGDCIPLESAPTTEPTQTEAPFSCPTSDVISSKCECCGVIIASFLVMLWILLLQRKQLMEDFKQIISLCECVYRPCRKKTAKKGSDQETEPQRDNSEDEQHPLQDIATGDSKKEALGSNDSECQGPV